MKYHHSEWAPSGPTNKCTDQPGARGRLKMKALIQNTKSDTLTKNNKGL